MVAGYRPVAVNVAWRAGSERRRNNHMKKPRRSRHLFLQAQRLGAVEENVAVLGLFRMLGKEDQQVQGIGE